MSQFHSCQIKVLSKSENVYIDMTWFKSKGGIILISQKSIGLKDCEFFFFFSVFFFFLLLKKKKMINQKELSRSKIKKKNISF